MIHQGHRGWLQARTRLRRDVVTLLFKQEVLRLKTAAVCQRGPHMFVMKQLQTKKRFEGVYNACFLRAVQKRQGASMMHSIWLLPSIETLVLPVS